MSQQLETIISPSALAADFAQLGAEIRKVKEGGAKWIHMDIMDGHFVPNVSMGFPVLESVNKAVDGVFMDCHMMVSDPLSWIESAKAAGGQSYTFHLEALSSFASSSSSAIETEALSLIGSIRSSGLRAAVAISPSTPSSAISDAVGEAVDMLLVMTVVPGKGGQKFIPECTEKVRELRARFPGKDIQVDGGVGPGATVCQCAQAGSNVIVAGTAVFRAPDPAAAIQALKDAVDEAKPSWPTTASKAKA